MVGKGFKIRFAKPNELGRVGQLVAKLHKFQHMEGKYEPPKLETLKRDLLWRNEKGETFMNKKNTFVAIAVDNSREAENQLDQSHIVGYLVYTQSFSFENGRFIDLNQIFIDETHRNCGLGEKFIKFVSLHAKLLGDNLLQLYCYKFNSNAIRFYERIGFYNVDDRTQLSKRLLDNEIQKDALKDGV